VKICFISDLHLADQWPAATRLFLDFLDRGLEQAGALYILGDLFDSWVGDDDLRPSHRQALDGLRRLTNAGKAVYLMHGNRDFLLGPAFETATGARILPEPSVIEIDGSRTLIMHGDTLCTDDVDYQRFRHRVRRRGWQRLFLSLPLSLRRQLARRARERSSLRTAGRSAEIMDVNQSEVAAVMSHWGASTLVHGHTHRPGIHDFELDGRHARRIVLGAWGEHGSVLVWEEGRRELARWSLEESGAPASIRV
jgi:UDP-2,3-diacylglucosamine hydrolase